MLCFPLGTSHPRWETHGDWKMQGQDVLRLMSGNCPRVTLLTAPRGIRVSSASELVGPGVWNRGVLFLYACGSWGVESGCPLPLSLWVPGCGIGVSSASEHVGPGVRNWGILCL